MKNSVKNLNKIFTFSLIVLVVLALAISLAPNSINVFENDSVSLQNTADYTTYVVSNHATGAGLEDGSVGDGFTLTGGTELQDVAIDANTEAAVEGSTYYYLTEERTVTTTVFPQDANKTFSGTLDGRGNILNINASQNPGKMSEHHYFGGLVGTINGATIKNITLDMNVSYKRDFDNNSEVGGIAGYVGSSGVTLENVKVICNNTDIFCSFDMGARTGSAGLLFGKADGNVTLKNVTFVMNKNFAVHRIDGGRATTIRAGLAVGLQNSGKLNLQNVSITGTGNVLETAQTPSEVDTCIGTFLGQGSASINGVDAGGWTGQVTRQGTKDGSCGAFVGWAGSGGTVTTSNIFKKDGVTSMISESATHTYYCDANEIGFCRDVAANVWVGRPSSCSDAEKNGEYVVSFKSGVNSSTLNECYRTIAIEGAKKNDQGKTQSVIPIIAKTDAININTVVYGEYAFMSNELNTVSGSNHTFSITSDTVSTIFNTKEIGILNHDFKIYREDDIYSKVPKSKNYITSHLSGIEVNSSTTEDGYYYQQTLYAQNSPGELYNNNESFVVFNNESNYYKLKVKINKASADNVSFSPLIKNEIEPASQITLANGVYEKDFDGKYACVVEKAKLTSIQNGLETIIKEDIKVSGNFYEFAKTITVTTNESGVEDYNSGEESGKKVVNVKRGTNNEELTYTFTYTITSRNFETKTIVVNVKIKAKTVNLENTSKTIEYKETDAAQKEAVLTAFGIPAAYTNVTYFKADEYQAAVTSGDVSVSEINALGNYRIHISPNNNVQSGNTTIEESNGYFAVYPAEVSITNAYKQYDGETNLNFGSHISFSGVSDSSVLNLSGIIASFDNKNVGRDKNLTINEALYQEYNTVVPANNITVKQIRSSLNYCFSSTSFNVGVIYPKTLTLSYVYKEYDKTANIDLAKGSTSIEFVADEYIQGEGLAQLGLSGIVGIFNNNQKDVTSASPVTIQTNVFSYLEGTTQKNLNRIGTSNYALDLSSCNDKGYIYPKTLSVNAEKMFDENDVIYSSNLTFDGFISGDEQIFVNNPLNNEVGTYNDRHVGTKTLTFNSNFIENYVYGNTTKNRIIGKNGYKSNYCVASATIEGEGTITVAPVVIKFNDVQELYDSILDESPSGTYDFIYVRNSEYATRYLTANIFKQRYIDKYLSFIKADGSEITLNQALQINAPNITGASAVNYYDLTYGWADNTVIDNATNNYDISNIKIKITSNPNKPAGGAIKIRIVGASETTGAWSNNTALDTANGDGSGAGLIQFINSRYYDGTTFATTTTYKLNNSNTYYYDNKLTANRVLPSYKTIDGNNAEFRLKQKQSNKIATVSGTYNHATISLNNETFNGVGIFVAKNYGTIRNINLTLWDDNHDRADEFQLQIHRGAYHTSFGFLAGINEGIIKNNTILLARGLQFHSANNSYSYAIGNLTGINAGYIADNNVSSPDTIVEDKKGNNSWAYYEIKGTVKTLYYGRLAGASLASGILETTGNVTYKNNQKVNILDYTGDVYAGGLVGYNDGSLKNLTFYNNQTAENNASVRGKETLYKTNGNMYAGMITGYNNGSVENCLFINGNEDNSAAKITLEINPTSIKSVYYGGITGYNTENGLITASTPITVENKATIEIVSSVEGGKSYSGGIAGYNKGKIDNYSFKNESGKRFAAILGAQKGEIYIGGIAGFNDGNSDQQTGLIQNAVVDNLGTIIGGNQTYMVKAYYVGGITGVNSGGCIDECIFYNRAGAYLSGDTVLASNNADAGTYYASSEHLGFYLGGLLGAGCENGTYTAAKPMKIGTYTIKPGFLTNSKALNFGTLGANHGSWGYVTGRYNTVISGGNLKTGTQYSQYEFAHEYGKIIWYTSNTPSQKPQITLFGGYSTIFGYIDIPDENLPENVYISGVSGIGVKDFGDNTMAIEMLTGLAFDANNNLSVSYKNPDWTASKFTKVEAYVVQKNGTKVQATFNGTSTSSTNVTANATGSLTVNLGNVDTVTYSAKAPAETINITFYVYAKITVEGEWLCFIGDRYSSNDGGVANYAYDNYIYCAGYATLQNGFTIDQNAFRSSNSQTWQTTPNTLKSGKVLDGNNKTITFNYNVPDDGIKQYTNDDLIIAGRVASVTGMLIALNEGTIKNLNIEIKKGTGPDHRNITPNLNNYYNNRIFAFGGIAGVNRGIIDSCKVTVNCMFGLNFTAKTADAASNVIATAGTICGINDGGEIKNSTADYGTNGTLEVWKNKAVVGGTGMYVALGGAIGIAHGGTYENITTTGKGEIRSYSAEGNKATETYIGGVFGLLPLGNNLNFASLTFNKPSSINTINAFYAGRITSDENTNSSAALISGLTIDNGAYDSSKIENLYNAIQNSNIRVLSYGNIRAFQKHAKNEYSLYGYLSTYTKDYTKNNSNESNEAIKNIISSTYRIVLEDGSYSGLGIREQTTSVAVNTNGSVTVNITWNSAATSPKVTKKGATASTSSPTSISITNNDITSAVNRDVWYNIEYTVIIPGETIAHNTNTADSLYINFISGVGNEYVFAGATTGKLDGNIWYDKQISAVLELNERKIFDGNNKYIYAKWNTQNNKKPIIDKIMGQSSATNDASDTGEYNIWYQATSGNNPIKYYGVSDCISINRGTIKNLNFEFNITKIDGYDGKHHDYSSLTGENVNTAYGSLCGVNLGIIENCVTKTNTPASFTGDEPTGELLVSPGVGLNNGVIRNTRVELTSSYEYKGVARSIIMGGIAAVNAYDGSIINSEVIINGNLKRSCVAKTDAASSGVVFGGIVGINDGGAIDKVRISGNATISVSSDQNKTITQYVLDENGNKVQSKDASGNLLFDNGGNPIYETETVPDYCDDASVLYFALGVAISNNEYGTTPEYLGHAIASCVTENNGTYVNNVKNIIIGFNGNVQYNNKEKHWMGIAFARASDHISASYSDTTSRPAYEGIIIDNEFGGFLDLYTTERFLTEKRYSGTVVGLSLPLMGHVIYSEEESNFVNGGRIASNVGYNLTWSGDDLLLTLALDDMLGVEKVNLEEMPEKRFVENLNSTTYYTWSNTNKTQFTLKRDAINKMFNTNSYLMQIEIFFRYPYVDIYDAFQLRQFVEFDQNDTAVTVKTKFLQDEYVLASLRKVGNEKKITSVSDISQKSWFDTTNTTLRDSLISNGRFTADEMYEDTVSGRTFVLEKFAYTADGVTTYVPYYSAKYGQLKSDIILDRYNKDATIVETIDVGWNTACKIELDESKRLTGAKDAEGVEKYKITLVANSYDYNRIGDAEALSDINATPAHGTDGGIVYCISAFVGKLRGEINSIDFIFRDSSQINITDYLKNNGTHVALEMRASVFTGLVAGYSTGKIDNCNLNVGNNTQFFINKKLTDNAQNGARTGTFMGGMVGLMGRGATVSNATVNMGDNSIFAINANGYQSWYGPKNGEYRNYVGGIAGMMIEGSLMYNVKIEGSESSLLMSIAAADDNEKYKTFFAATGGVVGCSTTHEVNGFSYARGLGKGEIDGVIFNWKGACLTMTDENNKSEKNLFVLYYGGGAFGYVDDDIAVNTYYAFDIANFKKYLMTDTANNIIGDEYTGANNNGHYMPIHNIDITTGKATYQKVRYYSPSQTYYEQISGNYVKVENLTKELYDQKKNNLYTTRTYDLNLNYGSNNNIFTNNEQDRTYHTLGYSISFKDAVDGDTLAARRDPSQKDRLVKTQVISVYELTNERTIGDGISITGGTISETTTGGAKLKKYSNITGFVAQGYTQRVDLGDILSWGNKQRSAPIYCKFSVETENVSSVMWSISIRNATPGQGKNVTSEQNAVTKIPVYQFAKSIIDANQYKNFDYIIQRSQGDGMEIYYCTGDAAILSPDKNYYVNTNPDKPNEYDPLKAIMYDGKTEASALTIDIYNRDGNAIERLQNAGSGDASSTTIARQIYNTAKAAGDIGVEVVESSTNNTGDTSLTRIGSYTITIKIYSNSNRINDNSYVSENYRTQFFNSGGEEATLLENGRYLVDTYIIRVVIAPISISFTKISKEYDETSLIESNKSDIKATVQQPFTYSLVDTPTVSLTNKALTLSGSGSNAALILQGDYYEGNDKSATVGDKTAKLKMANNKFTYTIYEAIESVNGTIYKSMEITQRYLLNKTGGESKSYFTIYEDCIKEEGQDQDKYKPIDEGTEYVIAHSNTCPVQIIKATPLVIEANFNSLYFNYTGSDITPEEFINQLDTSKIKIVHENIAPKGFTTEQIQALFNSGDLTLTAGEGVRDVVKAGHDRTVTITYSGNNFKAPANPTTANIKVYVIPKEIEITKVIKKYDGDNTTTNADFTISGTVSSDNINANDLRDQVTYNTVNVDKDIQVTVTPSDTLTYNSKTYRVVELGGKINYCVSNTTYNKGIITPKSATIENAYKTYDGQTAIVDNQVLIKGEANDKLDYKINATFATANVGETSLNVTLFRFEYDGGVDYLLTDNGEKTNYKIAATSENYTATNIAYIRPKEITINYVSKEFDNDTSATNATFDINQADFIQGDSHSKFDGSYASAKVMYSSQNTYNTINLDAERITFKSHNGTSIIEETVYCLKNGSITNYCPSNVTASGTSFALTGKGVIIPKALTISRVEKEYDGNNEFNTKTKESNETYYSSGKVEGDNTIIHIKGTFSSKNATTESSSHTVTITSKKQFTFNGATYDWLYEPDNSSSTYNYCVGTGNIEGKIKKKTIKIGSGSQGELYNLYFEVHTNVESSGKVSFTSKEATATYTEGQTYKISNLKGNFKWNNITCTLENGEIKYSGETVAKLKLTGTESPNAQSSAYTYTLSLTSDAVNDNFEMSSQTTLKLTINKRAAESMSISYSGKSKVYDGKIVTGSSTETLSGSISVKTTSGNKTVAISSASVTISINGSYRNVGTYAGALTASVGSISHQNYTFSGAAQLSNSTYSITPLPITISGEVKKAFDGTNSPIVVDTGIIGEKLVIEYTELGVLPGTYSGDTTLTAKEMLIDESQGADVNTTSTIANYTVTKGDGFVLRILNASIVAERYLKDSQNNTFNVALSIPGLKGLTFLVTENLTEEAILKHFIETPNTNTLTNLKTVLASMFMVKYNDSEEKELAPANIKDVRLQILGNAENPSYALEFDLTQEKLDGITYTDRYLAYMATKTQENNVVTITPISNKAESSSELAEGQFDGEYYQTGTAISNATQLLAFINGTESTNGTEGTTGYLTGNIHNFDAKLITATSFTKTLDGNGYSITLMGGVNSSSDAEGFFLAQNAGRLRNINFVFASIVEIEKENANVGLVVGKNTGTIENCSLKILNQPEIKKKNNTPIQIGNVGGYSATNTGTISNVSVIFSTNITLEKFAGIAYESSGLISYVAVRQIKGETISIGNNKAIVNSYTNATNINYVIKAANLDLAPANKISKVYDSITATSNTKLEMFGSIEDLKNGYIDYYFATNGKITTNSNKHNEYDFDIAENENTSYYYGYSAENTGYTIAIETIAPYGQFIWEAYGANYTTYGKGLNRAVAMFSLTATLKDSGIGKDAEICEMDQNIIFITSEGTGNDQKWVTIFNPALGKVVTAVIAEGADTIRYHEYNGSPITATFNIVENGVTSTVTITGTDVGTYSEYFSGAAGGAAAGGDGHFGGFDIATRSAKIVTTSGSTTSGSASIMLIITPKAATFANTWEKEYDTTNIAEEEITVLGSTQVMAIGEYDNSSVATNKTVKYTRYIKKAAIHTATNTFLTCYRTGATTYTVSPIYIGNQLFKTTTQAPAQDANNEAFAKAYNQLISREDLEKIANAKDESQNYINQITYTGIASMNLASISNVDVFELDFGKNSDPTTSAITYTTGVYYAGVLYKANGFTASNQEIYKNYKIIPTTGVAFSGAIKKAEEDTRVPNLVVSTVGRINKRAIEGTYSNLNQSYRDELSEIKISVALNATATGNLPKTMTDEQKTQLNNEISAAVNSGALNAAGILETIATQQDSKIEKIDNKYYAKAQKYAEIVVPGSTNSYEMPDKPFKIQTQGTATLTLRYFRYNEELGKYKIESIDDLIMIGNTTDNLVENVINDYDELHYYVTKNINAKSKVISTIQRTFKGTIVGKANDSDTTKTIKNIVLTEATNATAIALFNELDTTASIENIKFINLIVLPINNSVASINVVSNNNYGSIENVEIAGQIAANESATIAINPVAVNNTKTVTQEGGDVSKTGTTSNNTIFMQIKNATNKTVSSANVSSTDKYVVLFREYGRKTIAQNIASTSTNIASDWKADESVYNLSIAAMKLNSNIVPLAIDSANYALINNFRQYWVYINICPWLQFKDRNNNSVESSINFIGVEFER